MPYTNEHAARLIALEDLKEFRRKNDVFGPGVDAIYGRDAEGVWKLQAIRFAADRFTPKAARKWLKNHGHKPVAFEPAARTDRMGEEERLEMEVFRAGDYGEKGVWTDADVGAIAADYDPAVHEAPITVDHSRGGPAWGWIKRLRAAGGRLLATVAQMPAAFRELVKAGRYTTRSAELYRSFAATGRPYLRAVTFLGARPPEVKGLADVTLSDDGGAVLAVAFDEKGDLAMPEMPDTFTKEQLDAAVGKAVKEATDKLAAEHKAELEKLGKAAGAAGGGDDPRFAEQAEALKAVKAELEAARTDLLAQKGEHARMQAEAVRREADAFCEGLEREGVLTPAARKAGLVEFMASLSDAETLSFGEGEAAVKLSPRRFFDGFLKGLPKAVPTGRIAGAAGGGAGSRPWAEIAAEFAEGQISERFGVTLEQFAKFNYGAEPPKG
jgi:hypothetical protein